MWCVEKHCAVSATMEVSVRSPFLHIANAIRQVMCIR